MLLSVSLSGVDALRYASILPVFGARRHCVLAAWMAQAELSAPRGELLLLRLVGLALSDAHSHFYRRGFSMREVHCAVGRSFETSTAADNFRRSEPQLPGIFQIFRFFRAV